MHSDVSKKKFKSPVHTCDSNTTRLRFEPIRGGDWSPPQIAAESCSNREYVNRAKEVLYAKTIKDTLYRNQLKLEWDLKGATEIEIKSTVERTCKKSLKIS